MLQIYDYLPYERLKGNFKLEMNTLSDYMQEITEINSAIEAAHYSGKECKVGDKDCVIIPQETFSSMLYSLEVFKHYLLSIEVKPKPVVKTTKQKKR